MRAHSDALAQVLRGSFSRRLIADVFHGSERVLQDVDLLSWSLDGDLGAEVKMGGSGTVAHQSVHGESLTPEGAEGILSPFRARLFLLMEVTVGGFSETVQLGWFKVTGAPYAQDHFATVNGERVVIASVVDLVFESLDVNLKRRGFRSEEQPPSLASCWAEIRRITNMPVVESVPDKPIPAAIVYEATRGGRLKGVQALAGVLGGSGVINPAGAVVVVPDVAGDPVGSLLIGMNGTVTDVPYAVETETVYNCVVGNFETAERTPIYAVAQVTIGPLAVSGPYGENTLYVSSDLVKTQAQADAFVAARLAASVGSQQFEVPIQCIINPLFELGDPLKVVGHVRPLQGVLVKFAMSDSELMTVTLKASRVL
ncbi:hypothetical protein [Cryobacterium cryoconiti]|uniref:DUF5047 domain-containing protein n=1 Tax=Cryobacterium cryoconiti TaxID=1259239 RepID=A0A4Y8JRH8_9MICO|nr:hypothetical protein [Cryobacterium cryoconiti]TFD27528.1 hypothetical protein E3T49_13380 [Cryobacterium cryoconiti]